MKSIVQGNIAAPFAAAFAALFVVMACQVGSRASWAPVESTAAPSSPTPLTMPSPTPAAGRSPAASDGCGSSTGWVDYLPYTTATLAGYGWDFVVADVVGFEPAIFNTADGKRPRGFLQKPISPKPNPNAEELIYTPVDVLVERTISGPLRRGPSAFLIVGGTIGCYRMWVDVAPRVQVGSRYVFILADALDSSGQNTLPLPEAKFAWWVDSAGMVRTVDGLMSIDELTEIVLKSSPSPQPSEITTSH